jgi:hypothetical protein
MSKRFACGIAVMLIAAGCGGGSTPASPSAGETSVSSPIGNWSGSMSDPVSGSGALRLSLDGQSPGGFTVPGTLGGNWSATFRNGDSVSGFAVAIVVPTGGYGIVLNASPPPPCATGTGSGGSTLVGFSLINVVATSRRMTAVSARNTCSFVAPNFGSIDLARQ